MSSHGRTYTAAWMTGQAGRQVRVRYMPHHDHEIEVCDARGRHLGPAHLADAATPEQLQALREALAGRAQRLGALTTAQAEAELAQTADTDVARLALPGLIPPAPPPAHW